MKRHVATEWQVNYNYAEIVVLMDYNVLESNNLTFVTFWLNFQSETWLNFHEYVTVAYPASLILSSECSLRCSKNLSCRCPIRVHVADHRDYRELCELLSAFYNNKFQLRASVQLQRRHHIKAGQFVDRKKICFNPTHVTGYRDLGAGDL